MKNLLMCLALIAGILAPYVATDAMSNFAALVHNAAQYDNAASQFAMGIAYLSERDDSLVSNIQPGLEALQRLAENGNIDAQIGLGMIDAKDVDSAKHFMMYIQKTAEFLNDNIAVPMRHMLSVSGWKDSMVRDANHAIELLTRAAEHGYHLAPFAIGIAHLCQCRGLDQNLEEAAKWFRIVAEIAHTKATAIQGIKSKRDEDPLAPPPPAKKPCQ